MLPTLAKAGLILAALYLAVVLLMAGLQRRFVYPVARKGVPGGAPVVQLPAGFEGARLATADGLTLHAAWRAPRPGRPVAVFFHGNGSTLRWAGHAVAPLAAAGFGLLIPEYRGYGGNPGAPSEDGLYADGRAALAWLAARGVPPDDVVLIGNSIGSGIATQLAAETPVGALVLISPFTSLPDVAANLVRWAPVRLLLRDRYENRAKIGRVTAPALILHGERDRLIPIAQAEALAAAKPGARLVRFPGSGHELAWRPEAGQAIVRWLSPAHAVRYEAAAK